MMNEAKLRQRSLLKEADGRPLPKEVEEQAIELLVELFVAVGLALEKGGRDEQDRK